MRRFLALLTLAGLCQGHDFFLLPSDFRPALGSAVTIGFHSGDGFPESVDATDPARYDQPRVTGAKGAVALTGFRKSGTATQANWTPRAPGSYWVSVSVKPRTFALAADKFKGYLEEEGLTHVLEYRKQHGEEAKPGLERYSKHAKSYLAVGKPSGSYGQVLGLPIEFVPMSEPAVVAPGGELAVQLLRGGKPFPNASVQLTWADLTENRSQLLATRQTDAAGQLTVTFPKAGRYRLHTVIMERRTGEPGVDWESYWASLTLAIVPGTR